jgi:hypothetical protein
MNIDRTSQAITRQMKAINSDTYRIGIYNRQKNSMENIDNLTIDKIHNRLSYFKAQNANGNDIFICPSVNNDRAIILVDDLKTKHINEMKIRGHNPACIIQTSPCNFQVWVSLGIETMSADKRKIISRYLCHEYKGDVGCIGSNHYGRLAGFTNRKQQYLTEKGYPYVLCIDYTGEHAYNKEELIKYAEEELNKNICYTVDVKAKNINQDNSSTKFAIYYKQWQNHVEINKTTYDLSRGDYAVVCRMLKEGFKKMDICNALVQNSPNIVQRKGKHIYDYALRTIDAAEKKYILKK